VAGAVRTTYSPEDGTVQLELGLAVFQFQWFHNAQKFEIPMVS
jgi:hypothetical protein